MAATVNNSPSLSAGWSAESVVGAYASDDSYHAADGTGTASWGFTGLSAGPFMVALCWVGANANRATAVPFQVFDSDGTTVLASGTINQFIQPADFQSGTGFFKNLLSAPVTITGTSLTLKLTVPTDAGKFVIADAARIVPYPDPDALTDPVPAADADVTYNAAPAAILSPPTPATLVMTKRVRRRPYNLISPAGSLFSQDFSSVTSDNWTAVTTGSPTRTYSSGTLNISTNGAASYLAVTAASPLAAFFTSSVRVSNMPVAGKRCRVSAGLYQDGTHYLSVYYDSVLQQVGLDIMLAGTRLLSGVKPLILTGPFTLSMAYTLTAISIYVDAGSGPVRLGSYELAADYEAATLLAGHFHSFGFDSDVAATCKLSNYNAGYFGSIGINDWWPVRNLDGTEYDNGDGLIYFTADNSGLSDAGDAFGTTHVSVYAVNPTTLTLTETAKIYVNRSGNIFGDANGVLRRDVANSRWIYVHINTGDHDLGGGIDTIWTTSTATLLSGVHVITSGTAIVNPAGATTSSTYDPDFAKIGGQMYFACATTSTRAAASPFYPSLYTCDDDFTNLVQVFRRTVDGDREGSRLVNIGGTWYACYSHLFGGASYAYVITGDGTGTGIGSSQTDADIYMISAISRRTANGVTQYLRLTFDDVNESTNGAGPSLSNGHTFIYEYNEGALTNTTLARRRPDSSRTGTRTPIYG